MEGYFLIADILGFSRIVTNGQVDIHKRITQWTKIVDDCANEQGIPNIQLISDTLFAACPSSPSDFLKLLRFSRDLLEKGIQQSLPIRGAIGYGEYTWGRLTYGETVIKCHQGEQNQDWIGIACLPDVPVSEEARNLGLAGVYPTPCQSGVIQHTCVVFWDPPCCAELVRLLCDGGLTRKGEALSQEWLAKVHNTLIFKYYQKVGRDFGLPKGQFFGRTPLELIECRLYGWPVICPQDAKRPAPKDLSETPPSTKCQG